MTDLSLLEEKQCPDEHAHLEHPWYQREARGKPLKPLRCRGLVTDLRVDGRTIEQRLVEQLAIGVQTVIGPAMQQAATVHTQIDRATGDLIIGLRTYLQAEEIISHTVTDTAHEIKLVSYEKPTSTWAMFKSQHKLAWWFHWFVVRRPPKLARFVQHVTFDATLETTWRRLATYPLSTYIPLPEDTFGPFVTREYESHELTRDTSIGRAQQVDDLGHHGRI